MKKDIHPKKYRFVVFQDVSCEAGYLKSTQHHWNIEKVYLNFILLYTGRSITIILFDK